MLIICDKNKKLINEIKKLDFSKSIFDVKIECMDILKCKEKYPDTKICTASNPSFTAGGGLDKILKDKYPEEWKRAKEFNFTNNLFFLISVDESIKTDNKIIERALCGVFGYARKHDLILTGIGTSIGGMEQNILIELFKKVIIHANLSNADLSSADLRYANLSNADLSSADLRFADLRYANLSSADLRSANLSSADLRYANLSNADLSSADLRYANLSNANLRFADLSSANLSFADLRYANLSSADLRSANLRYANLSSADLRSANLSNSKMTNNYKEFIKQFKFNKKGLMVYKAINNTSYPLNKNWIIEPNSYLEENVNPARNCVCGCGVNFGTLDYVTLNYPNSDIWECLIELEDLCEVVVPYTTDGKARCSRLKLIKKINGDKK